MIASEKDFEALRDYVRKLVPLLGLQHFELRLQFEEPPGRPDAIAMVDSVPGTMLVRLFVSPRFWTETREYQRETILHELIHLMHREVTDLVENGKLEAVLGTPAFTLFIGAYRDQVEKMVDRMATTFDEFYPLPRLRRK